MKYKQVNLLNSLSATSSAGLEDGHMPAIWQDSPQNFLYGQPPCPVSPSPSQEAEKEVTMNGTYGPYSSGLLSSADLQSSLESRLYHRLPLSGGIRWRATWKELGTPQQRCLSRLVLSEPIIEGTDSTGARLWPTPTSLTPPRNGNSGSGNSVGLRKILLMAGKLPSGKKTCPYQQLNPAFVRWLMGYPEIWCVAALKD